MSGVLVAALATSGDPRTEAILLDALDKGPQVQSAAVDCLAAVGTTAAVPRLRHLADVRPGLRLAARAAVLAIQERAQGAAPGQLALAADRAGELAIAGGDRAGALGLVPPEDPESPQS